MSEWTTIRNDIETDIENAVTWLEGTKLAQTLKTGYQAALTELSTIAPEQLETAVETIGVAALGALAGGTDAAIAAGIAAAPAAFEKAAQAITATTTNTLVSAVVTGLQTTPVPVAPISAA